MKRRPLTTTTVRGAPLRRPAGSAGVTLEDLGGVRRPACRRHRRNEIFANRERARVAPARLGRDEPVSRDRARGTAR
ncbi:hypothetical protein [Nonomuraea diastatica]|uniref:hypothetical protein n=1 Tax=Nonomuraea diastatica TaxID=1848329 RepID=UPI003CCC583B